MDNLNILLVDDEPANVQVLFAALEGLGKITFATNGAKAIELAKQNPPHIIFLDYFMPEMSGLEVCKKIKEDKELQNAQIIFISGSSEAEEVEAALRAGAFDFITKPVIPALLRHKIDLAKKLSSHPAGNPSPETLNTNPQNILLVEDGAINRAVIAEILESKSHTVTMAETGSEAIELFDKNKFDCVLLDIHLPDMTGLKVIRHLKANKGLNSEVRIIAVTGDVTTESLEDYKDAGFHGVTPKPVEPEILLDLIAGKNVVISHNLMSAPDIGGPDLLIDQHRIKVLKETYSETRVHGLFALFEKEVSSYLKTLKEARDQKDVDKIQRTSHRLKSALGHFACARMQKVTMVLNKEVDLPIEEKIKLINMLDDQLPATLQALSGALDIQDT